MSLEMNKTLGIVGGIVGIVFLTVITTLTVQKIDAAPIATAQAATAPATPAQVLTTATNAVSNPAAAPAQSTEPQIIDVRPHYITEVVPYRSCRDELEPVYAGSPGYFPAGAMVGGAAGALMGHSIGHGRGRIVGTIAGALIGAVSGDAIQQSMQQPQVQMMETVVCHTHYLKKTVQHGYEVTYLMNGHERTRIMSYNPTA
jgi:uncharacterized protein YcfJ